MNQLIENPEELNEPVLDRESRALTRYLDAIGSRPMLDTEAELELARAAKEGDDRAMKKLVESNLRLVVHVATRHKRTGVPLRDLIAEGNMGLMRAARTYEARPGGRFANYAIWWIRRHVLRAVLDGERSIRLPLHRLPGLAGLRRARNEFLEKRGREPSADELSELTGIPAAKVVSMLAAGRRAVSLSAPLSPDGDGEATVGDRLSDDEAERPDHAHHRRESMRDAVALLDRLSPRESKVMRLRYGLDGVEPHTCEQIGKLFGLTRERVRQIQDLALRKLRRAAAELDAPGSGLMATA